MLSFQSEQEVLQFVITNERGYLLLEAILSLLFISFSSLVLLHVLPPLFTTHEQSDAKIQATNLLYVMADSLLTRTHEPFTTLERVTPFKHTFTLNEKVLCVYYEGADNHEAHVCLPQ